MFKINYVKDANNLVLKNPNLRNLKELNDSEKSLLEVLREEKLNKSKSSNKSYLNSNKSSPRRNANMDLVPLSRDFRTLSDDLKNGSDNIFSERNEDRIIAIRNQMD